MQFVLWYNSVGGLKMIIEILLFLRSSDLVYNVIWRALKDYDAMSHVLFLKLRKSGLQGGHNECYPKKSPSISMPIQG